MKKHLLWRGACWGLLSSVLGFLVGFGLMMMYSSPNSDYGALLAWFSLFGILCSGLVFVGYFFGFCFRYFSAEARYRRIVDREERLEAERRSRRLADKER